tara:strand:- start:14363 stop:14560 length:198 start_codon:yes stop_codon:yes gene_type:complete
MDLSVKRFRVGDLLTNKHNSKLGLVVGVNKKTYLLYDYRWKRILEYSEQQLGEGIKYYEPQKQTQ